MRSLRAGWIILLVAAGLAPASRAGEHVLFAFDDRWLPFRHGVKLSLISYQSTANGGDHGNQVLGPGPAGAPDAKGLIYYGTVCEVNGELWMWYLGLGDQDDKRHYRVCLAKSRDGRNWERPELGVVPYGDSTRNNLVDLDQGKFSVAGCVVYHDPEDPDPARRFKMAFTGSKYPGLLFGVAYSPDGVRWTESPRNPRGTVKLEPQGGIKWRGAYYLNGQGGAHWAPENHWMRQLVTHQSYDFEEWTTATVSGFRRDPLPPRPHTRTGGVDGEQVHLGAGLWDRGNVIIGFYGQWHGHPNNDRRYVSIDTGMVISHDALAFKEPIPEFRVIQARETPSWWTPEGNLVPFVRAPALQQGQGFANIGDETLFWYSVWVIPSAGVRLARWERDRLGYLQPHVGPRQKPHLISAPIPTEGRPVKVSLNVSGLGEHSAVKVTLLDEQFRPLPGFAAAELRESGLRRPIVWPSGEVARAAGPIRVRVDFVGARPEDIRFYAAYVTPAP